jgi:tetratricopeptide (TPR) repeat protein
MIKPILLSVHCLLPLLPLIEPLPPIGRGDLHVDEIRGFRIGVPEGWITEEQDGGRETGFRLTVRPTESPGGVAVSVQIRRLGKGVGIESLLAPDRDRMGSEPAYSGYVERASVTDGRESRTVEVVYQTSARRYRIRRTYFEVEGAGWILQDNAQVDHFADYVSIFDRVHRTFELIERSEEGKRDRRLTDLAARCGSEVRWAKDWPDAAARSRRENRPVLVVAWLLASFGTPRDARHGVFNDPEVVALVNERFVPLWYVRGMGGDFVEKYGLSRTAFGKAMIAATPEGEVLFQTHELDEPSVVHEYLRTRLQDHPEYSGTPLSDDLSLIERATGLIDRGEFDRAKALLARESSARAFLLRARMLLVRRRASEALDLLDRARAAGGLREAELLMQEARVLLRLRRHAEAEETIQEVLRDHSEAPEYPEALFLTSLRAWEQGRGSIARENCRVLTERYPESPFAWQAAHLLRSTGDGLPVRGDAGLPPEDAVAEIVAPRKAAPCGAESSTMAIAAARDWLLSAQRADGSWVSPTELTRGDSLHPEPFVDAITALAGRALLAHIEAEDSREAVERALSFVRRSITSRESAPPLTWVMDYTTWSDACMLDFLAEVVAAGVAEVDSLTPEVESLLNDLRRRRQSGGGWSYLVTGDPSTGRPASHSISFVTSTVVLSLLRAREVGFAVPEDLSERGAVCLARMRGEDGTFAYRLLHDREDAPSSTPVPGGAGRGPACELALLRAGLGSSEHLRGALDTFLEHSDLYSAESGKALAHAGPYIVGCHYFLFDCAGAARVQAHLPPDPRVIVRLRELVGTSRLADGSFLDNPVVGRACGTALALSALDHLERARGG